jgi:hypothetical protein
MVVLEIGMVGTGRVGLMGTVLVVGGWLVWRTCWTAAVAGVNGETWISCV